MKKFIDICQFTLILFGLMICGLFMTTTISLLPLKGSTMQWCIFGGQNILAFILPALLTWKLCFKTSPLQVMGAEDIPRFKMVGIMLLIYFVSMPALNQVVYWNQEMHLPDIMAGFEKWCRDMETLAEEQTKGLLSSTGLFPTAMNILIIGVLTGIGEEFFFRGALQRMLMWCRVNPHVAIWTAAVVFSALHFQFFGFFPRVLLGVLFGYLYWWSGNIWLNSAAHALNNSLVIVSTWLINKGMLSEKFDMVGVSEGGFPLSAVISTATVALIIYWFYRRGLLKGHSVEPPAIPSHTNTIANATESN